MEVLLMRHGKTAGNISRRYVGSTDEPLCPEGIAHAFRTGTDRTVLSLYSSPMKRAVETARIKFPNAQILICADLREMDFGDFEGKTLDELAGDEAYLKWLESNCTLPCPNGERMDEFSARICRAFDAIVRQSICQGESRIVIVAHGGSIMSILSRYGRPPRPYYDWYVENCAGYRARLDETSWDSDPALTHCEMFLTL